MDALKDHPATWATEKRASNGLQIFVGKIPDTWVIILTSLPVILMLEVHEMYGAWGFRFNGTTFTKVASVDRHCYQFEQLEFKFHGVTLGVLNILQSAERT